MHLEEITSPADIRQLDVQQLEELAVECRAALLTKLSAHGGHVGPNLGVVEATIALHYVFDTPADKLVFDVSHQTYVHKMLTGRAAAFLDPAAYDSVTGFTNPDESEFDLFTVGHTSTSVALALGLAKARDLAEQRYNVVAFIGDGSLSGGEAFEGLNNAAALTSNFIVVVNDNDASIAPNQGGLYSNLAELRATHGRATNNYFTALGFDYVFVEHGNDLRALIDAFTQVKDSERPVVVHMVTTKGLGYEPAMANREAWHSHVPFDLETGESRAASKPSYAQIVSNHLLERMAADPDVIAITSATPAVMGFTPEKRAQAGAQFLDVGIAEECAVAVAAGLARGGAKPVYGVQSTFLQRSYDQLSHELCLDRNPATLMVFGGSVYNVHDATHHGFQDIPMLTSIPNLVYIAPATVEQYLSALDWSIDQREWPVALKVPGGQPVWAGKPYDRNWSELNRFEVVQRGSKVAIFGLGAFLPLAVEAAALIERQTGVAPTVVNPLYASGLDEALLEELASTHKVFITLEDGYLDGGFGEKIARFMGSTDVRVKCLGLPKEFRGRYDVQAELARNGLTAEQIAAVAQELR